MFWERRRFHGVMFVHFCFHIFIRCVIYGVDCAFLCWPLTNFYIWRFTPFTPSYGVLPFLSIPVSHLCWSSYPLFQYTSPLSTTLLHWRTLGCRVGLPESGRYNADRSFWMWGSCVWEDWQKLKTSSKLRQRTAFLVADPLLLCSHGAETLDYIPVTLNQHVAWALRANDYVCLCARLDRYLTCNTACEVFLFPLWSVFVFFRHKYKEQPLFCKQGNDYW